jgi:hypothetical protein
VKIKKFWSLLAKNGSFLPKNVRLRSHVAHLKKSRTHAHRTHVSTAVSHAHCTRANVPVGANFNSQLTVCLFFNPMYYICRTNPSVTSKNSIFSCFSCYYLENQVFGGVNNQDMSLIEMCFYSRLYGISETETN